MAVRRRLGEILVAEGLITAEHVATALDAQQSADKRERLGQTFIRLGLVTERDIAVALAHQLNLEVVDLSTTQPEHDALARVPAALVRRTQVVPLRLEDENTLRVVMADPTNILAIDDLKATCKLRKIIATVGTASQVQETIRRAYGESEDALQLVDSYVGADDAGTDVEEEANDQPIIRLANAILTDALRLRASDVHIEPARKAVRVRYRIDGMLKEVMQVPGGAGAPLVSRIKIMALLDIAERRRPQDGRAELRMSGESVDLRVSTLPSLYGETVVLRLLRKGVQRPAIAELGMNLGVRAEFERALAQSQGMILVTGPTGCGKTTTLYAGLATLATEQSNIITLEDPIEYELEGVNQTQVNPRVGLTFANGMRTVLRQDPDIVMIGEIRDEETALLAFEASMTGHLVLSTLHTNDAPSTISRMRDLGVAPFMIASSLSLVSAQRLMRINCIYCAKEDAEGPSDKVLALLGLSREIAARLPLRRGLGCASCAGTGFLGRAGIMEVLRVTPRMRELIAEGARETEMRELATEEGSKSLRQDGLLKAFAGNSTFEEVLRVTPEDTSADVAELALAWLAERDTGADGTAGDDPGGDNSGNHDHDDDSTPGGVDEAPTPIPSKRPSGKRSSPTARRKATGSGAKDDPDADDTQADELDLEERAARA